MAEFQSMPPAREAFVFERHNAVSSCVIDSSLDDLGRIRGVLDPEVVGESSSPEVGSRLPFNEALADSTRLSLLAVPRKGI